MGRSLFRVLMMLIVFISHHMSWQSRIHKQSQKLAIYIIHIVVKKQTS